MSEMKLSDILGYSIKIEHESMLFYKAAIPMAADESVKSLLSDLADEEVKHEKSLSMILNATEDGDAENFDHTSLDKLIQNSEIPKDSSELEVLNIALEREKHTRDFYSQVATMTNLAANVVDLFELLYKQEAGHVKRITRKIEEL